MKTRIPLFALIVISFQAFSQHTLRKEINFPDIEGYHTLKCDFHTHTVFSDGKVWPTVRVDDAWRMGLDAISITDHIEYQPHKDYIPTNHDAGYEIALPHSHETNLILIKGSEITRHMPPGHLNGIFITDSKKLETEAVRKYWETGETDTVRDALDYMKPIEEANRQGGFVFWNHPGWASQAPNGIKMYDVHKDLIKKGLLKGVEVVNWDYWYPEALDWCIEYNLTVMSNSDVHEPSGTFLEMADNTHMPVTLVFAKERTEAAIKEALLAGRTAAWFEDKIIGKEEFVDPLVKACIKVNKPHYVSENGTKYVLVENLSSCDFTLVNDQQTLHLKGDNSVLLTYGKDESEKKFTAKNVFITSDKNLDVVLRY